MHAAYLAIMFTCVQLQGNQSFFNQLVDSNILEMSCNCQLLAIPGYDLPWALVSTNRNHGLQYTVLNSPSTHTPIQTLSYELTG